jgi:hypothetical protein
VLDGGETQEATIREVIAKGWGNAYEKLRSLDCWPILKAQYDAELVDPLIAITDRIRLTYKRKIKADWWLETGLTSTGVFSQKNLEDARAECVTTRIALQRAMKRRDDYLASLDDRWDAVAPLLQMPDGTKLKLIAYGSLPHYPWPSEDRTITIDFAASHPFESLSNDSVSYPEDTILRFTYTLSHTISEHAELKAIIAGGRCVQLLPTVIGYDNVEEWVMRLPKTVRARLTVSLPAA